AETASCVSSRGMLEESVSDLRTTMCELQERLQSVDGEGNEWKTRYETQLELNEQLERQMSLIHGRLEDLRGNPVGEFAFEALRQRLKLLTEEKSDLHTQATPAGLGLLFLKQTALNFSMQQITSAANALT
uniref:Coiled-coil domain containing 169 n=1 Tax=Mola mola TaxID=94237 RepID=A0A3Q3WAE3_MOLML